MSIFSPISISLSEIVIKKLDALSKALSETRSVVIRRAISELYDKIASKK
jgi:predicted transcriptional regulator